MQCGGRLRSIVWKSRQIHYAMLFNGESYVQNILIWSIQGLYISGDVAGSKRRATPTDCMEPQGKP